MSATRRQAPAEVVREPAERPRSSTRHGPIAQLLLASSPLSLVLVVYFLGDWISAPIDVGRPGSVNRLGFGLHESAAAVADRHVFGAVPSVWLQQHLVDGSSHWWDALASLVYVTHFVGIPVVTVLVWFRHRERYGAWIVAVLGFITVGVAGYVVFPAAPPWLASDHGYVGPVDRTSGAGWDYLHLPAVGELFKVSQAQSNPIAAMPSLHAGAAALIALFLWPVLSRWWRVALVGYALAMAVTLIYTGEHYVVDVLAGWLTAVVAVALGRRRGLRPRSRRPGPVAADRSS